MSDDMRQQAIRIIEQMPEGASLEDIMYELYFCSTSGEGMREAEEGKLVPHEEVVQRMSEWLEVFWTLGAAEELEESAILLQRSSGVYAATFVDRILAAVAGLQDQPRMGRVRA